MSSIPEKLLKQNDEIEKLLVELESRLAKLELQHVQPTSTTSTSTSTPSSTTQQPSTPSKATSSSSKVEKVFFIGGGKERIFLDEAKAKEMLKDKTDKDYNVVKVSGISVGFDAAKVIAQAISQFQSNVHTVDFSDCIAGRKEDEALKALDALSSGLKDNKNLIEINLSNNALGRKGVVALQHLLSGQHKLEKLYFNNNGLAVDAVEKITEFVLGNQKSTKLRVFQIYNNLLEDQGAVKLGKLIGACHELEEIRVASTRISVDGSKDLANSLLTSGTTKLESIDLSDNNFSEEAFKPLCKVLEKQSKLQSLHLGDTLLENEGVIAICQSLKSNTSLVSLNLSGNDMTGKSVDSLIDSLTNKKLKKLILSDNELKAPGLKKLAVGLSKLNSLEVVDICNNQTNGEGAIAVVKSLVEGGKSKHSTQSILLNGNSINAASLSTINEILSKNGYSDSILGSLDENEEDEDA